MNAEKSGKVRRVLGMLLLFVLAAGVGLHAAIPAIERQALIALYNTAGGDNWRFNSGWKEGALEQDGFGPIGSEGNWYGIEVANGHVTEIDLSRNTLTGVIPPELGNLGQLEKLDYIRGQPTISKYGLKPIPTTIMRTRCSASSAK
jgi:hypothetical protein